MSSTFFQKNISLYAISNDQSFNNTLTNEIVRFEQRALLCIFIEIVIPVSITSYELLHKKRALQTYCFSKGPGMHSVHAWPLSKGTCLVLWLNIT